MKIFLKVAACFLMGLIAPVVTLFYRGGWFNTPDDPTSPRGMGEPFMRKLHAHLPAWIADWWWLGLRNRAYGFAYAMKPAEFRGLHYASMLAFPEIEFEIRRWGYVRTIRILGYAEHAVTFEWKRKPLFHILYGYRLAPIANEVWRNNHSTSLVWDVPHRPINMDARPILSFRSGAPD